jgi:hypothetical protein
MPIHAYRLVYSDSPPTEMLWEWEEPSMNRLLWNAKTFGRTVVQCTFLHWNALAEANQRIWETSYLLRPSYEPWDTWQAWMAEYRSWWPRCRKCTKRSMARSTTTNNTRVRQGSEATSGTRPFERNFMYLRISGSTAIIFARLWSLLISLVVVSTHAAETFSPAHVAVYFSPNGGATDAVVRELTAAKTQVLIQAYAVYLRADCQSPRGSQ